VTVTDQLFSQEYRMATRMDKELLVLERGGGSDKVMMFVITCLQDVEVVAEDPEAQHKP